MSAAMIYRQPSPSESLRFVHSNAFYRNRGISFNRISNFDHYEISPIGKEHRDHNHVTSYISITEEKN